MSGDTDREDRRPGVWVIFGFFMAVILALTLLLAWDTWTEFRQDLQSDPIVGMRNIGLLLLGLIGLPLAIWRSLLAYRQVQTQIRQADGQTEQIALAQRSDRNSRFQTAVEMLTTGSEGERLAGFYVLDEVRHEDPDRYHVPVSRLFASILSNTRQDGAGLVKDGPKFVSDYSDGLQIMMFTALGNRTRDMLIIDKNSEQLIEISDCLIRNNANRKLDFSGFMFSRVVFGDHPEPKHGHTFESCNFEGTVFLSCNLSFSVFVDCMMYQAWFDRVLADGATFNGNLGFGQPLIDSDFFSASDNGGVLRFRDVDADQARNINLSPLPKE